LRDPSIDTIVLRKVPEIPFSSNEVRRFTKDSVRVVLTINCIFDEETGLDGLDPLGKLLISDAENAIAVDLTYLDSWLASLIDSLARIRTNNHVVIEVDEEPKAIDLTRGKDGRLTFKYATSIVVSGGVSEMDHALRIAANQFVKSVVDLP
jgi:hypothetical protein